MTRIWTPEELEECEARVNAARAGDVGQASGILYFAALCLEKEWPFPEPLRLYLIAAFTEITCPEDIGKVPYPQPKNLKEMRKDSQHLEWPRDANAALNLKRRRGRQRSHIEMLNESAWIDSLVADEMRAGKSLAEAIDDVAEKMGISDRKVAHARRFMKSINRSAPYPGDNK
jgi:hypothetical protein